MSIGLSTVPVKIVNLRKLIASTSELRDEFFAEIGMEEYEFITVFHVYLNSGSLQKIFRAGDFSSDFIAGLSLLRMFSLSFPFISFGSVSVTLTVRDLSVLNILKNALEDEFFKKDLIAVIPPFIPRTS